MSRPPMEPGGRPEWVRGEDEAAQPPALVERCCRVMHDAYEAAARRHGWQTQERSRKAWEDVPEENKATMREAVAAVLATVTRPAGRDPGPPRPGIDEGLVEKAAAYACRATDRYIASTGVPCAGCKARARAVLAAVAAARPAPAAQPAAAVPEFASISEDGSIVFPDAGQLSRWLRANRADERRKVAEDIAADVDAKAMRPRDLPPNWKAVSLPDLRAVLARAAGSAPTADTARDEGDGDG